MILLSKSELIGIGDICSLGSLTLSSYSLAASWAGRIKSNSFTAVFFRLFIFKMKLNQILVTFTVFALSLNLKPEFD